MLVVFAENQSPRFEFAVEFIAKSAGLAYKITNKEVEFLSAIGNKVNYSFKDLPGLKVLPTADIWNNEIDLTFKPSFSFKADLVIFFNQNTNLGFDPFAMAFWCLSRYPEYQLTKLDDHKRYLAENEIVNGKPVYQMPYLDFAIAEFLQLLNLLPINEFEVLPTIDVDMAFMFAGKSIFRRLNSWFKSKQKWLHLKYIFIHKPLADPYSIFNSPVFNLLPKNTIFFWLLGEYALYDKNIRTSYIPFQNQIKKISNLFSIGLHPSYLGNEYEEKWIEENQTFCKITGTQPYISRQHYIMLKFGENATYNTLINMGIKHDYSMGFVSDFGFRAGTARSFYWFDLIANKKQDLLIHPFVGMDVITLNNLKMTTKDALNYFLQFKNLCKTAGLPYRFIFHNESLSNYGHWKTYHTIFLKIIE